MLKCERRKEVLIACGNFCSQHRLLHKELKLFRTSMFRLKECQEQAFFPLI